MRTTRNLILYINFCILLVYCRNPREREDSREHRNISEASSILREDKDEVENENENADPEAWEIGKQDGSGGSEAERFRGPLRKRHLPVDGF